MPMWPFSTKPKAVARVVGLTELGKEKAEAYSLPGKQGEIVIALHERGPLTAVQLAQEIHCDIPLTKTYVATMIKDGYLAVKNPEG